MNHNKNKTSPFHIPHVPAVSGRVEKTMHIAHEGASCRLSRSVHSDPYDLRNTILIGDGEIKYVEKKNISPFVGIKEENSEKKEVPILPKETFADIVLEAEKIPVVLKEKITAKTLLIPKQKKYFPQTKKSDALVVPKMVKKMPTLLTKKIPLLTIPVRERKNSLVTEQEKSISIPVKSITASVSTSLSVTGNTPQQKISPTKKSRFFARTKKEKTEKKSAPKKQKKNTVLAEVIRFSATTAVIFLISFGVMNAPALGQLLSARLDPVGVVEKEIALKKVVADTHAPILPTAGMKFENRKSYPSLALAIAPLENRIVIPSIGKNVPIVGISDDSLMNEEWKQLEKDIQEALKDGVVHYPGTANPGQVGNAFITGHSSYYFWDAGKYKDVFALLHDLYAGDEFTIFWNQDVYHYRVSERKVVAPSDTSVLNQPRDKKIVTLMTCTPIGTAKDRLILVAEQVEK